MCAFENPEDFVGESGADVFHAGEVEDHNLEAVDPGQQALGLGAGDQLFQALPQQMHGDDCFIEAIIVICGGKRLVYFLAGAGTAVRKIHEDGRAGAGFFPLQNPILFFAVFMGEIDVAGQDGEVVQHARGKEDAFARMMLGVGGEFAFSEFQDGVAFILQVAVLLDFPEDANSVVAKHDLRTDRVSLDMDAQCGAVGVIDGVVDHFARGVFPDTPHIRREVVEKTGQMIAPDDIFMEPLEGETERFFL